MIRRTFVRTAVLGGLGAIFVPKYERWFRPLTPKPPVGPVTFMGMTITPEWPLEARPGDLAVLVVAARDGSVPVGVLRGWTMAEAGPHGAVFHKVVGRAERPIQLANASLAQVAVFRNAEMGGCALRPRTRDPQCAESDILPA